MTTAQDGGKVVSLTTYQLKGKAVPLYAWSGPEGSRKLRFPDFMTTAQDGSKVVSLTHRSPLTPGNTTIINVKQSRYRSGVAQRVPGSLGSQIS